MAYSYSTYYNWDYYPILVLCIVFVLGTAILTLVNIVKCCLWQIKLQDDPDAKFSLFCSGLVYGLPSLLLNDTIKENENEVENGEKYAVKNRRVPPCAMYFFFLLVISVLFCVAISFWEVFLTSESFSCDPRLDCFPVIGIQPLSQDPLTDCSFFEDNDDSSVTVICYQFALRYSEAAGTAGGILALAVIVVRAIITVIFWIAGRGGVSTVCYYLGLTLALLISIFFFFILIIGNIVPFLQNTLFKTKQSVLKFAMYYILLLLTSGLAACAAILLKKKKRSSRPKLYCALENGE